MRPKAEQPVVFEDEDDQRPERPSLAGEAKQLEFTEAEILCSVFVTELRTEVPVAGPRCAAWARSRKSIKLVHRSEFTGTFPRLGA